MRRGRITSLRGVSMTHLSRVWTHASLSEEVAPVICPSRGSPCGCLLTLPSSRRSIASLFEERFRTGSYSKKPEFVNEKIILGRSSDSYWQYRFGFKSMRLANSHWLT